MIEQLKEALGGSGVLTGEDVSSRASGVWDSRPMAAKAVLRPTTTEEVSQALKICFEHDQVVVPMGGMTGLVESGHVGVDDVGLSLERMNQVEEINATDRTMLVQAGVPLQTLQEKADEYGLMFPLDLGARGSCLIGGNISTNAGGNRVIRYGMTRAMVLGVEAVLADGTVVSSLNRMIKNNAGYDLKQLFIGTEGTLGIVTRAVLRLQEKPASQETVFVAVDEFEKLTRLLKAMDKGLGGTLSAFEVMWNSFYRLVTTAPAKQSPPLSQDYPFYVLIEAMGGDQVSDHERMESVLSDCLEQGLIADAVISQSQAQTDQIWAMRDDVEQLFQFFPFFAFDVSLPISRMQEYLAVVEKRLTDSFSDYKTVTFGHMGDGNLHIIVSVGDGEIESRRKVEACVYQPLADVGGSVSAEHGVGLEKKPYLEISRDANEIDLMRRIKKALDPKGLLNPGKIFDIKAVS